MSLLSEKRQGALHAFWVSIRRDPLALGAMVFLLAIYLTIPLAGFLAPYAETFSDRNLAYAPPTPLFVVADNRPAWPFVVTYERRFDPHTYGFGFYPDYNHRYPIRFWVKGDAYRLLGLIPTHVHLFGVDAPARLFLLGTDINGHDNFSRLLYGGQISLTVGFLALFIVFPIGLLYGAISGYCGGKIDTLMMRLAEVMMSFPSFYLLITLAAILPASLSSRQRFMLIVAILALIGWAGLSRIIRGMVLAIKQLEFVEASRALGAKSFRIVVRHLIPQTATYFIIAATLNVPGYLLAESGLSLLGLGIQPPDASWGNMLGEARDLSNIMIRPWLLLGPGVLIFLTILSFNLLGDKLRDVLDPKRH
jgi:peptide/nickel transport system permease protein